MFDFDTNIKFEGFNFNYPMTSLLIFFIKNKYLKYWDNVTYLECKSDRDTYIWSFEYHNSVKSENVITSYPTLHSNFIFWILISIKTWKICINIAIHFHFSCWRKYHPLHPVPLKILVDSFQIFLMRFLRIMSKLWTLVYIKVNIRSIFGCQI